MKAIIFVILLPLVLRAQTVQPSAKPAPSIAKPVPITAKIIEHLREGGLMLDGGPDDPANPSAPVKATGKFILRGHPKEAEFDNLAALTCYGIPGEPFKTAFPNGAPRILRTFTYAEPPPPVATPVPKPTSTALGAARLGSPALGDTHGRVKDGWLEEKDDKGVWKRVKRLK